MIDKRKNNTTIYLYRYAVLSRVPFGPLHEAEVYAYGKYTNTQQPVPWRHFKRTRHSRPDCEPILGSAVHRNLGGPDLIRISRIYNTTYLLRLYTIVQLCTVQN